MLSAVVTDRDGVVLLRGKKKKAIAYNYDFWSICDEHTGNERQWRAARLTFFAIRFYVPTPM